MPPSRPADDPADRWAAPFACRWRLEGREAASVRVSGELDLGTAARLDVAFREALGYARLILLDLQELSFMDSTGLHVIVDASVQARVRGARIVVMGASPSVEALLDLTGSRSRLDLLETRRPTHVEQAEHRRPMDNPVNDRVLMAKVMAVSDVDLWMRATDGTIHRPWAPASDGLAVPAGSEVELYFDATGAVNGWYEPLSGLAINQRGLEPGESPAMHADLACQGRCGLVWLAPAGARFRERGERCLTCAGPLVPQ